MTSPDHDNRRLPGARLLAGLDPPEGPAYILLKRPDGSLVRSNPFVLHKELRGLDLFWVKPLGTGALLLWTSNPLRPHFFAIIFKCVNSC